MHVLLHPQRHGNEDDLRVLDDYRRSFGDAYEAVVQTIRGQLHLEPTGRPAKSTTSLIEKLHRESIRLAQVQDIAGCRVVVTDVLEQNRVVASLKANFPEASVMDRRAHPSYGYRAVHVIVQSSGKAAEIQVRTSLQHRWAELSEKFADMFDPAIKYGGGAEQYRNVLAGASGLVALFEETETQCAAELQSPAEGAPEEVVRRLREVQEQLNVLKRRMDEHFNRMISGLDTWTRERRVRDDLPD